MQSEIPDMASVQLERADQNVWSQASRARQKLVFYVDCEADTAQTIKWATAPIHMQIWEYVHLLLGLCKALILFML